MSKNSDTSDPQPDDSPELHSTIVERDAETDDTLDLGPTLDSDSDDCDDDDGHFKQPRLATGYQRYTRWRTIGTGGVGTVSSVYDPNLGRHIAVKELHSHLRGACAQRARFFREARVTAQLQHPNIIPVHELGTSVDGSTYFAMKKVQGLSLQDVLNALKNNPESKLAGEYPLSKRIDIFIDICQAIAFAHSRGAIHRDLKPENILLGSFGEVLVTDWGLVKVIGEDRHSLDEEVTQSPEDMPPEDSLAALDVTREGAVSGTPLYMSPEQALGQVADLDHRSDIYSLGTILYELLTLEKTVTGNGLREVLEKVLKGAITPPKKRAPKQRIPCDLSAICMKCLKRQPDDRYQHMTELIADLRRYQQDMPVSVRPYSLLEQSWKFCVRHPVMSSALAGIIMASLIAVAVVGGIMWYRHASLLKLAHNNRLEGNALYTRMFELQEELEALEHEHHQKSTSEKEQRLRDELTMLANNAENSYRTAVMLYVFAAQNRQTPMIDNAMMEIFKNRIEYDIMTADYDAASRWFNLLERWLNPDNSAKRPDVRNLLTRLETRLAGEAWLGITSEPAGAMVQMQNLDTLRREGHGTYVEMGPTPIPGFAVPKGRYLLNLYHPERPMVSYPVLIGHGERRHLIAKLPRAIPEGTVFVPPGTFLAGGEHARYDRLHEAETQAFFIKQHEVTFGEYLRFWLSLPEAERSDELMSRMQFSHHERRFHDAWDADGTLLPGLSPELPVVGISRAAAAAYCAWLSDEQGRLIRLPSALEWEKAARGVDGRAFPWGDTFDPSYAFISENEAANQRWPLFAEPGSFPKDRSLYGVMDMGGNVREWTGTPFPDESPFYQIKGASASTTRRLLYAAYASDTPVVPTDVGFRYVIPYQQDLDD